MELINNYEKSLRGISGVYRIRNLANNKFYIGSTSNLYQRFIQYKSALEKGNHHSIYLQRSFDKYGTSYFIMEVLLLCKQEYLLYYEQQLIEELNPDYNMNKKAVSNKGYKWSEESREKARKAQLGNTNAAGHILSEDSKQLISKSRKGKCVREQNGFYGKTHTEEVREKIREAQTGRKHSEETRKKQAESHYKSVRIDDVIYESLKAASEASGINKSTLSRWCKDERKPNYAFV